MKGTTPPAETHQLAALLAALTFAADKHRNQRRKDNATPYINHPIAVVELLARIGKVKDLPTLQAAILHDTLEDTQTSVQELDDLFGKEIRQLVEEVTDNKRLPSHERKRLQIEHAPHLSTRAKQIKIADKISNITDVAKDSVDWPLKRKLEYLDWAEKVVAGCRGTSRPLEEHFDKVHKKQRELLISGG